MDKLTSIAQSFITFINGTLVPLVFAIAFIMFLWGVFNYFIRGADNPEKRDTGRQFVIYGIVGFFIMISVWGLVNLLTGTFKFDSTGRPCLPTFGKDSNCSGSSNSSGTSGGSTSGTPQNILPDGVYTAPKDTSQSTVKDPTYGDTGLPAIY